MTIIKETKMNQFNLIAGTNLRHLLKWKNKQIIIIIKLKSHTVQGCFESMETFWKEHIIKWSSFPELSQETNSK